MEWYTDRAVFNGNSLFDIGSYEIAIKPVDRYRGFPYRFYERELYKIAERGYEISISGASPYYIFALMCYMGEHDGELLDVDFYVLNRSFRRNEILGFSDFTEAAHVLTAKISAPEVHSQNELKKIMSSYLFNIAYNKDIAFTTSDFREGDRRGVRRFARRDGQLFPYKAYSNELTTYYYQGLSTNIPFAQYLAFYHVAEYFFQIIAEEDAFKVIEDYITKPSFSPYKKDDIRGFYNKIKKIMREQKEDDVWDEKNGFLLCLKKYVPDLESLKNTVNSIDPDAINYYKTQMVPFASKGGIINFADSEEAVYATIRNRVYAVRNAIVHSKEGENLRYEPFKHDRELLKEIPLVRAIAEEIIINSSKRLEFMRFEE